MIAPNTSREHELRYIAEAGPLPPIRWVDDSNGGDVDTATALRVTAIYACVRFLAETVAAMPMHLYRKLPDGDRELASDHPLFRTLCVKPNAWQSYYEYMEQLVHHVALWGNSFSLIVPGERGFATELRPLHPSRMTVQPTADGDIQYHYWMPNQSSNYDPMAGDALASPINPAFDTYRTFTQREIFHVRGMTNNGYTGIMPANLCRNSIELARKMDSAAIHYWENNARPSVILESTQAIPEGAINSLRSAWKKMFGGTRNVGGTCVLPNGITAKIIDAASRESAQYMELRNSIVTEIARAFRIGPTMIGDLSHGTYSNVEMESLNAQVFTITPWQRRIEGAIQRSILDTFGGDLYCKIDSKGMMRGDSAARSTFYNTLFQLGAVSPNDVRRLEDMDPIEDEAADQYFVQLNMAPLSKPEPVVAAADGTAAVPAAAESLNGAQVSSMLEILTNVSTGLLKADGAIALIGAAFPQMPADQVRTIVAGVVPGMAAANQPAAAAVESEEPDDDTNEPDETGEMTDGD